MTETVRVPVRAPANGPTEVVAWADGAAWDAFVATASDGTLGHRWAWGDVVSSTYGHRVHRLAAVRGGEPAGVLPLVHVRSRLFGRSLVSMPYLDTGGLCTDGDAGAERVLMSAAHELADRLGSPLELRHLFPRDIGLPAGTDKVTMTIDVSGGEDAVWAAVRSNRRGQVRKARRLGLTAVVGGSELVRDFYRVWAVNMRDLGSPVHPRSFFERTLRAFGDDARVVLVRDDGAAVGGGVVVRHRDRVVLPWSSSLRASLGKGPNQLLYWEAIRHAIATGAATFDFGRSSRGAGTFDAKREWGAETVQLHWHGTAPDGDASRLERMDVLTRVWRRLPVPVTVAVGARLRGGISR